MSKLVVPATKPRNPLVAAARLRQAGPHDAARRGERRNARRALQRELAALDLAHGARSEPPGL